MEPQPKPHNMHFIALEPTGPVTSMEGHMSLRQTAIELEQPTDTPDNWSQLLIEGIRDYDLGVDTAQNVQMFHYSGIASIVHSMADQIITTTQDAHYSPPEITKFVMRASKFLARRAAGITIDKFKGDALKLVRPEYDPLSDDVTPQDKQEMYPGAQEIYAYAQRERIPADVRERMLQAYCTISDMATGYLILLVGNDHEQRAVFSGRPDIYIDLMTYVDSAMQHGLGVKDKLSSGGWRALGRVIYSLEHAETYPREAKSANERALLMSSYAQLLSSISDRYFIELLDSHLTDKTQRDKARQLFPSDLPLRKLRILKELFHDGKIIEALEGNKLTNVASAVKNLDQRGGLVAEYTFKSSLRSCLATGRSVKTELEARGVNPGAVAHSEWMHELICHMIDQDTERVLDPATHLPPDLLKARFFIPHSRYDTITQTLANESPEPQPSVPQTTQTRVMLFTVPKSGDVPLVQDVSRERPLPAHLAESIWDTLPVGYQTVITVLDSMESVELYNATVQPSVEIQWFPRTKPTELEAEKQRLVEQIGADKFDQLARTVGDDLDIVLSLLHDSSLSDSVQSAVHEARIRYIRARTGGGASTKTGYQTNQ